MIWSFFAEAQRKQFLTQRTAQLSSPVGFHLVQGPWGCSEKTRWSEGPYRRDCLKQSEPRASRADCCLWSGLGFLEGFCHRNER